MKLHVTIEQDGPATTWPKFRTSRLSFAGKNSSEALANIKEPLKDGLRSWNPNNPLIHPSDRSYRVMAANQRLCSGGSIKSFKERLVDCPPKRFSYDDDETGYQWTLSIPQHNELAGLLRKLLRQAGLTIERFNAL